jgi:hypothetical protein
LPTLHRSIHAFLGGGPGTYLSFIWNPSSVQFLSGYVLCYLGICFSIISFEWTSLFDVVAHSFVYVVRLCFVLCMLLSVETWS